MNPILSAYVNGMIWLLNRVKPPFDRLVRRWHSGLSRKINGWIDDGSMYFEYDQYRNKYIIATPHYKNDPDDYEIGHTAGKISIVLGTIPLVLGLIFLEVISALAEFLPVHWIISLVVTALIVGTALFMLSATAHLISIGVEMQDSEVSPNGG